MAYALTHLLQSSLRDPPSPCLRGSAGASLPPSSGESPRTTPTTRKSRARYPLSYFCHSVGGASACERTGCPTADSKPATSTASTKRSEALGSTRLFCIPTHDAHEPRGADRTVRDELSIANYTEHAIGRWKLYANGCFLENRIQLIRKAVPVTDEISLISSFVLRAQLIARQF